MLNINVQFRALVANHNCLVKPQNVVTQLATVATTTVDSSSRVTDTRNCGNCDVDTVPSWPSQINSAPFVRPGEVEFYCLCTSDKLLRKNTGPFILQNECLVIILLTLLSRFIAVQGCLLVSI